MNSEETDSVALEFKSSPCSAREAHIKLKALTKASMKMTAQLQSMEEENKTLQKKLEIVRCVYILCHVGAGCG